MLIILALLAGMITWSMVSKWLGLALIMVFVGGMMVAFLYVSSLSFNLKFQSLIPSYSWAILLMIFISSLSPTKEFSSNLSIGIFSMSASYSLIFLISYLLIVLFLVVKITESLKGSLTQKF